MKNVKANKTKKKIKKKNTKKTGKSREIEGVNEVFLIGRVTSIAGEKKMPSGDIVSEFRVVVERPGKTGKGGAIDTVDIAVWKSALRKKVSSFKPDNWVEIKGSVRRRFWQSAAGIASRWQVEASEIRTLK